MNNETRASESVTTGTRGPTRRTLVRTAAWSVPVISTVAAAPAFAANSDVFVVESSRSVPTSQNYIEVTVDITNSVGGTLSRAPIVRFESFTATATATLSTASVAAPAGWTRNDDMPFPYSVTYNSPVLDGQSASLTIQFPFNKKPAKGEVVTISGTVTLADFNPPAKGFSVNYTG